MSRFARVLCSLHGAAFLWLAYCAVQSYRHGAVWAACLFTAASLLYLIAVLREAERAEERRAVAGTAGDLNSACCERWWTSLATDHDPTCPNQTRRSNA